MSSMQVLSCLKSQIGHLNVCGSVLAMRSQPLRKIHVCQMSSDSGSSDEGPQAKHFPALKRPMLPPDTFKGRTAFITGGGTGLGRGMATMLSALGADVVIAARRLSVLEETASAITASTGRPVLAVEMDVRKPDAVTRALDQTQDKFGLPTIVINNAAGNFIAPSERLSPNAFRTITDIVLNGTATVTLSAGKRLIAAEQGGAFLSITTAYTRQGSGFVCPSAAAKAGVEAMSKSLSSEWGRYGLRFNCLAPGPVETEGAFSRLDPSGQFRSMAHKRIPAGRMGEVEEIANLATYLVSDYASWLSGESIAIDGGEFPFCAGAFNVFNQVTNEQWDIMEQVIKGANKAEKGVATFADVKASLANGEVILDVRSKAESDEHGSITGAKAVPMTELESALGLDAAEFLSLYGFPKPDLATPITTHCMGGGRAQRAADAFASTGYKHVKCYKGSFKDWAANGGDITKS